MSVISEICAAGGDRAFSCFGPVQEITAFSSYLFNLSIKGPGGVGNLDRGNQYNDSNNPTTLRQLLFQSLLPDLKAILAPGVITSVPRIFTCREIVTWFLKLW
jgi:hypothetical protein